MHWPFVVLIGLLIPALSIAAPSIADEARDALAAYLRIDTSNPPGNESKTAQFLKTICDREGIESAVLDLGEGRANFYAILRGKNATRSVILLHHMDVVPADLTHWTVAPFSGTIGDGKIMGRGATDIKGKGIIDLFTLIDLHRRHIELPFDVVMLAVADEEVGSIGTKALVKNPPPFLKNASLLIDEGAAGVIDKNGQRSHVEVSIGEKELLWMNLICKGPSGHASIPIRDSSINRLIRASSRLLQYDFSKTERPKGTHISNTLSLTVLKTSGDAAINTIPNEATLSMDARLAPGTSIPRFVKAVEHVVHDSQCRIEVQEQMTTITSTNAHPLFSALKESLKANHMPTSIRPIILDSTTDAVFYRHIGIPSYGYEYYWFSKSDQALAHGNDEFLRADNLEAGLNVLRELLTHLVFP